MSEATYLINRAIGVETGLDPVKKVKSVYQVQQHQSFSTQYSQI